MEIKGKQWRWIFLVIAGVLLIVGIWFAFSRRGVEEEAAKRIEQVTLEKGEKSVTLTREGTLTVRIPEGIFQQQWDEDKVAAFFSRFENEDFSQFNRPTLDDEIYVLTVITADGEVATYIIPIFDLEIPEIIEELIETLEEIVSVILEATPTPTMFPTPAQTYTRPSPTPTTTSFVFPSPTLPPQTGGGNGGTQQKQFECEFYDPEANPDIISETVCTPE